MSWQDQARGEQVGSRQASNQLLAERAADEELVRNIITQLLALKAHGILLPEGWRDKRPMTLEYLDTMLSLAIALCAAKHK